MFSKYDTHILTTTSKDSRLGLYGIMVGTLKAMENYACKPRILDDYYMVYISEGKGSFRCCEKTYKIGKGDIFFLFPGLVHTYKTDAKNCLEQWWIGFNGIQSKELLRDLAVSPESPILRTGHSGPEVLALFKTVFDETTTITSGSSVFTTGILYQTFGILTNHTNKQIITDEIIENYDHPIERALSFIEANYVNDITIDQVAKYASLSKAYFSTRFKSEVGMSPKSYLMTFRLNQAEHYLKNSNISIKDIAASVGFHDPLYFSKVFSQRFGSSPIQFRKQHISSQIEPGNKSSI